MHRQQILYGEKQRKKLMYSFFEEFIKPKNNIIDASYIAFAIIFQGV